MPSYVVVGASRGLGYAWLQHLSADKANTVIGLVRTPASVKTKLSNDKIENVHIVQADMVDPTSLTAAVSEVSKLTNGSVDYLIVNGAYQNPKTLGLTPAAFMGQDDLLREEFHQNMDVNVIGPISTINAFLPLVRKSKIKKITVISSGMGDFEFVTKAEIPFAVAYGALKAALNMIVLKYSIELKSEGIIFLAVSPGVINTREEQREYIILSSGFARTTLTARTSYRGRNCRFHGHDGEVSDSVPRFQRSDHSARKRGNATRSD